MELRCEWVDCGYESRNPDEFLHHVEEHKPHEEVREIEGKSQSWQCCMWEACGFDSQQVEVTRYHINFHAFHTRIKTLGIQLLNGNAGLECHLDYEGRNLLPVLPVQRICEWEYCNFATDSFQRFIDHFSQHVKGQPVRRPHEKVPCRWRDCGREYKNYTQLKSHLPVHTQGKVIGCPVCGTQFASKTKLIDHCMRQVPPENKRYKCSYCKKNFPSERIMRDHIRLHVNLHKCPFCDMTCAYPYTLTLHIRYRHLNSRVFACTFCDHKSTTERDLEIHHQTHCSENYWACEQEDCDFSCRTKNGLQTHYAKAHEVVKQYACHICEARFDRGDLLTRHLRKEHSYRWASGFTRFRYIKDEKGLMRLQTVRYESIEVTEQIMQQKPLRRSRLEKTKVECTTKFDGKTTITVKEVGLPSNLSLYPEDMNEEDVDDVQPLCDLNADPDVKSDGEETELGDEISRNEELDETKIDSQIDSDSEFGESLEKHLGLTGSRFIKVIKSDVT